MKKKIFVFLAVSSLTLTGCSLSGTVKGYGTDSLNSLEFVNPPKKKNQRMKNNTARSQKKRKNGPKHIPQMLTNTGTLMQMARK